MRPLSVTSQMRSVEAHADQQRFAKSACRFARYVLICKQYPSYLTATGSNKIMATTSTKTNTAVPDFEAATARVREAIERLLEASRKVSSTHLAGAKWFVAGLTRSE
jgi:hypothetical protein